MPSSLAAYSMGGVLSFGMPLLNTVVAPRYVWTLWRTGSVFLARIFCPTTAVVMRGVYMQSFWSISTGLEVSGLSVAGAPLLTWTQTFWSLPPFTSTDGSVIGFFAQYGSASRCSLTGVGGLPVKSTVPSIDPSTASAASGRAQPRAIAAILSFVIRPLLEVWEPVRTTRAIRCGQSVDWPHGPRFKAAAPPYPAAAVIPACARAAPCARPAPRSPARPGA